MPLRSAETIYSLLNEVGALKFLKGASLNNWYTIDVSDAKGKGLHYIYLVGTFV